MLCSISYLLSEFTTNAEQRRPLNYKVWRCSGCEKESGDCQVGRWEVSVAAESGWHVVGWEWHPEGLEIATHDVVVQTVGDAGDVVTLTEDSGPDDVVAQLQALVGCQKLLFLAAKLQGNREVTWNWEHKYVHGFGSWFLVFLAIFLPSHYSPLTSSPRSMLFTTRESTFMFAMRINHQFYYIILQPSYFGLIY